jgi:hypothetical protein
MRTPCLIIAIVVSGTLVSGCSKPRAGEPKAAQPVKTQAVAVAPPQAGVRYSATIEAFEQVQLAFKTTGYVDDLLRRAGADGKLRAAQAGDRVTKGTVLARVRETDYTERVTQGKAKLAEGEAAMTKARLNLERARALLRPTASRSRISTRHKQSSTPRRRAWPPLARTWSSRRLRFATAPSSRPRPESFSNAVLKSARLSRPARSASCSATSAR